MQCSENLHRSPAGLDWAEKGDLDTGASAAEGDSHRQRWASGTIPLPCSLQFNPRTKYSSSLGWSLNYSTSEEKNLSGHVKNYCGDPHRHIWPTVPSMAWTHGQERFRSAFVGGRKDYYWADNLPFPSPKCGIFTEQSNCCTLLLLLPLALTQKHRVFAIMKSYPINCLNFKP